MSILRDIFRRKGRSILTISGIAVGVFALVVLGAIAENSNVYIENIIGYFENAVTITEAEDSNFFGMSNGNRPMSMETIRKLEAYPGVDGVIPQVTMLLDGAYASVIPPIVYGSAADDRAVNDLALYGEVKNIEHNTAMLGSDIAKQRGAEPGETIEVRGKKFEIVRILDRTHVNLLDSAVFISLPDAQQLYYDNLPEPFRTNVKPEELVLQAIVYAKPGVDADKLADHIKRDIAGLHVTGPTRMMKTVSGLVSLLNGVLGTVAALALLIGGLSIVNTMTMAVSERTREMGVKRALGASRGRIARDVLLESALMGGIGGAIGLALGAAAATGLNSAMIAATGTSTLLVTSRLAFGAVAFAVVLGTLGGLYPARYASRLDPATALAYE